MATSAVPGAMAALVAILRAAPDLADVEILDGPPTVDMARSDVIAVGWSSEGEQAAQFAQTFNAAGARTRDEDFDIRCLIDVWHGGNDFAAVRQRAFAVLGVVENAIRASAPDPTAPTLNGAVLWAHLTQGALIQSFTDQGARAGLAFTVTCHARI
ncbi:hypothetical protein ACIP6X_02460 [Streptomyces coeruleorubidus]|uniref:hypothetical protein n=1 Tax=Streptomyces coeruleorubidus TaxID=116188 RepID=UPI0038298A51